ncbi:hypothetical protein HS048_23660 [Planomonospora sp. ID91781]|nr:MULTISPECIES: hypothetical protein [Planomonospora]MBG0823721.1 hypothetical protein [Planomonospora sp. ID91781]
MPVLRLLRATVFAVACVTVSLGMHVLAGGAAVDPATPTAVVPLITGGAFVLARRQRGLGTLLTAAFAVQYGLHHLFTAAAVQPPPVPGHGHGGLAADLGMLLAHAVTALLSAYWLERGETALATLLHLLVAAVVTLLVWRAAPAVRRLLPPHVEEGGTRFVARLLDAAVSRRGPPAGAFVF